MQPKRTLHTMLKQVQPGPDEKIYATDVTSKGAKVFYAKSLPSMWNHMQAKPRHHYEVLLDAPCHLFWDFDEGDVRAEWRKLRTILNKVFRSMGIDVEHVLLDASSDKKNSLHVITKSNKYLLESPVQGRSFIYRLRALFPDEMPNVDQGIYTRNRCFRMLGSSKFGSDRILKGEWSMEHWVNTLVQPYKMDVHSLGLATPIPAPMRSTNNTDTPKCVMDVLDWANASSYTWKIDLEWVWKGHLNKGECRWVKRQHSRNNRYFRYEAPDIFFVGCHHCRKSYRLLVPDELQQPVRKFLNQNISLT